MGRLDDKRWGVFAAAAVASVLASAGMAAVLQFQPFPGNVVTAIDDVGEAVAALLAAAACARAARAAEVRLRRAWTLMAMSAGAWTAGQATWSVFEVGLGVSVPFPSAADAGFLAAVPLAMGAVINFWKPGRGFFSRRRLVLDGATVVLALIFTGWALGLRTVFFDPGDTLIEKSFELAYPLGDILVGTVLIIGIRRATSSEGRMLLLLGGLAANALADSAFAYLTANATYTVRGSAIDVGWVVGYLMIALAALWPSGAAARERELSPYDLWQLAFPWLTVVLAAASGLAMTIAGHQRDLFETGLVGGVATLLITSMVLAQRESIKALQVSERSEATLAEVISRAPAGVVRIDSDLRIIEANPRFSDLLSTRDANMVGDPITRYFSESEAARFVQTINALASDEKDAVEADSEALRADGSLVWVHWSATAVPDQQGGVDYFIAMFEDTTARHQAEAAAAASLELMQRLNLLKTEFLQNVSHEFKTALIGIQGFSEFMRDADQLDVSDARAFAADIYRDAERLDRMVTEMLALDRVESSRAALRVGPVDMNVVIQKEVDSAREQLHGNAFEVALDPQVEAVVGDDEKLGEVMQVLLDHAIKSSPEGETITVTSRCTGGGVEVTVRHHGVGVYSEFDNRLFGHDDLYANNPIRKVVGTGLGLGIARQVVEMHGGRFWVDRPNGSESEFHFTIPVLWKDRVAAVALARAQVA